MSIEAAIDKARETVDYSPRGIQCLFVEMNEKWAIKLFDCIIARDDAYVKQKRCAKLGWGPSVGVKFEVPLYPDDELEAYQYGYVTEIIEPCVPPRMKYMSEKYEDKRDIAFDEWNDTWMPGDKFEGSPLEKLVDKILKETGFFMDDFHAGNWGMKDGKMVPLDFG